MVDPTTATDRGDGFLSFRLGQLAITQKSPLAFELFLVHKIFPLVIEFENFLQVGGVIDTVGFE